MTDRDPWDDDDTDTPDTGTPDARLGRRPDGTVVEMDDAEHQIQQAMVERVFAGRGLIPVEDDRPALRADGKPYRLTAKQVAFVSAIISALDADYVADGGAVSYYDAYCRAYGYDPDNPPQKKSTIYNDAWRLSRHPEVARQIARAMRIKYAVALSSPASMREHVVVRLLREADTAPQASARVSALRALGSVVGVDLFEERKSAAQVAEEMSLDEVRAVLEKKLTALQLVRAVPTSGTGPVLDGENDGEDSA